MTAEASLEGLQRTLDWQHAVNAAPLAHHSAVDTATAERDYAIGIGEGQARQAYALAAAEINYDENVAGSGCHSAG